MSYTGDDFLEAMAQQSKKNTASRNINRKKLTKTERQQVYDKCNGHCAYCGCELTLKDMQVDHVVAFNLIHDENTETMLNYLPACRSCNNYKHTMTIEAFRNSIERFPQVLMRDSVTYRNAVRFGLVEPKPHKIVFYFEKLGIEVNK